MTTSSILLVYPMCAMVLLTSLVLGVMFRRRVKAVRTGQVQMAHFKTFSVGEAPDEVLKASRHFTNLFEVPVLFYVACVVGMILPVKGPFFLILAWLFVGARLFHAAIHLGRNKILHRMSAFAASVFIMVAMWIVIFISALSMS